jgi:glycosyltransferase involved in cell wall biosynthesis
MKPHHNCIFSEVGNIDPLSVDKPLATIVLPLLSQHDEWLRQCLLSALNQSAPCEVIVVVSPETPQNNLNLLKLLKIQYGGFKVLLREPGQEFAGAINLGFQQSSTDRVGILLTDDWLAPSAVEECIKHTADIVSTNNIIYSEESMRNPVFSVRTKSKFDQLPTLEEKASFIGYFFLFKKEKVLEIGGVDILIGKTGADDYDMIWCLLENGATVSLLEEPLYHVRDHSKQRLTLRNADDCQRDISAILDKHGVTGTEKKKLLSDHGQWCGRKIFDVIDELQFPGHCPKNQN